ncbi:MAG: molybdopterin-guanine dinucleotide biosynthesis protein MobB [Pseudomonadota bacterium]
MELSASNLLNIAITPDPTQTTRCTRLAPLASREAVPARAKWSYVTRNVAAADTAFVSPLKGNEPQPGDLLLATVTRIAQHTKVQLQDGRRSQLFVGDELVLAYGNRYAPDQFEAEVPADLSACHLVAAGGIAAQAISKNSKLKWPTQIQPTGYLLNANGRPMNLRDYACTGAPTANLKASTVTKPIVCVAGTSMNAGKTTVMASLTKGLSQAGLGVAALKVTGTGAGNDMWAYADAGACLTLDFTDAGHASTYQLSNQQIEQCLNSLVHEAQQDPRVDVILVEIADGLLHHETLALMNTASYRALAPQLIFAAGEAMGALAGQQLLADHRIEVRAISGVLSASELALNEAAAATGLPVWTREALQAPTIAATLL